MSAVTACASVRDRIHSSCGVYNLHVKVAGGDGNVERAVDVSPNEMEVEVERGSRVSGGLRQVNPQDRER